MVQTIISQVPINSSELHAEMKRIKERDKELGFRAQKTIDYLESLNIIDVKKAKELMEKLLKLEVSRLRDVHFHKIIDVMPTNAKDVKVALQQYNLTVSQENCKKIADVVAEYV
jgi:DNA-directed RNA polymerase subunit F